jgi:hypothetical protein
MYLLTDHLCVSVLSCPPPDQLTLIVISTSFCSSFFSFQNSLRPQLYLSQLVVQNELSLQSRSFWNHRVLCGDHRREDATLESRYETVTINIRQRFCGVVRRLLVIDRPKCSWSLTWIVWLATFTVMRKVKSLFCDACVSM